MTTSNLQLKRQYDMDWIRVLATVFVFLYHCSMFFNPWPWHVKNNALDHGGILIFSLFTASWMMPIFFAVSGISVFYALQKRSNSDYVRERLLRLGVPLLLAAFILSPPQVYMERVTHSQFEGSFLSFLPHMFDGVYLDIGGTGNFAFVGLHLWYVLVLLIFSILTLPLFRMLRRGSRFEVIHFVVLPLMLMLVGPLRTIALGGWDLVFYFVVFIYGYYFFSNESFKPALKKTIVYHLSIAVLTSVGFIAWFLKGVPPQGSAGDVLFYALHTINCWSWLLCIFYFSDKYLSFTNSFLVYGSEASMPFYIIHQPVILTVGFFIRNASWPIPVKLVFLVVVSFAIIMIFYHFIIRHVPWLRILFGIKGKKVKKETKSSYVPAT